MEKAAKQNNMLSTIKQLLSKLGPLVALILLAVVLSIATEKFLTYDNLMNVLRQTSVNALVSSGMLLVLITAGIDLSVGSNLAFAICFMGMLLKKGVTNPIILLVSCLVVGLAVGILNGVLLTKLDLPHPFVSTMGMKFITKGMALLITAATPIGNFPVAVQFLGSTSMKGFPLSFLAVIVLFVFIDLFLNRTTLGRQIYCVGGNPEATRLAGIKSDNVLIFVYAFSGFMSALAGIVLVGRVNSASATMGENFDADAIAACIIGGASFSGGKGTIWGTLIGALLISVIRNGLNLIGASTDLQQIVIGAVIILAVFIDVVRGKMEARARRLAAT